MRYLTRRSLALLPLVAATLAACDATTPGVGQPVHFSVTSVRPSSLVLGPLSLGSFRVVLGALALGTGSQFGCADCTGSQTDMPPELVNVPLDGTPVSLRTEQVQPGTYAEAEADLVPPTAAILAATPGWASGSTIEVTGTYSGAPFTLQVAVEGMFHQALATPLVVGGGGASTSASVVIALPVTAWFTGPAGSLDPNVPADRATIEANIRASFGPPDNGRPESGD